MHLSRCRKCSRRIQRGFYCEGHEPPPANPAPPPRPRPMLFACVRAELATLVRDAVTCDHAHATELRTTLKYCSRCGAMRIGESYSYPPPIWIRPSLLHAMQNYPEVVLVPPEVSDADVDA